MEATVWLAIFAMACFGMADVLFKKGVQGGASPEIVLLVPAAIGAILAFAWALATGTFRPTLSALWALAAGVLIYISFNLFIRSMRAGAVSIAAPVFRLNFAVTSLIAIVVLAEPLSAEKALGFLCAVLAIWLLLAPGSSASVSVSGTGLAHLLIATTIAGVGFFFSKMAVANGALPATALTAQVSGIAVSGVLVSLLTDRSFSMPRSIRIIAPAIGIVQTAGLGALMAALAHGQASIVTPIAQLAFVVSAMLGFVVFREPVTQRKVLGLIAAVAAVVALGYAGAGQPHS